MLLVLPQSVLCPPNVRIAACDSGVSQFWEGLPHAFRYAGVRLPPKMTPMRTNFPSISRSTYAYGPSVVCAGKSNSPVSREQTDLAQSGAAGASSQVIAWRESSQAPLRPEVSHRWRASRPPCWSSGRDVPEKQILDHSAGHVVGELFHLLPDATQERVA